MGRFEKDKTKNSRFKNKYLMKITAGVDEVGRGSLMGPVYAAAVILNSSIDIKLLKDSIIVCFYCDISISCSTSH